MIIVENLEKSFHDKKILKGISCSFKKGETSLIIGQTGAGKTVFLKCLLGLHDYDNGKIIFDNIELNNWDKYKNLKLEVCNTFKLKIWIRDP